MTNIQDINKYVPINEEYKIEPDDSFLDDAFSLQRNTIQRKIILLQQQIKERKKNLEDNLKEIEIDLCRCGTIGLQIPCNNPEAKNSIVLKYKLPLYQEERKQRTEYLRDTAMLKKDLLDTVLQYLSLQDKQKLLE